MTAAPVAPAPDTVVRTPWLHTLHPVYRLIIRWVFIVLLTLLAFHRTLLSLVETTRGGGLGGYVWVVPIAGVLAAIGVARRNRTELPIHDRQTDVIVGTMGLVLALLLQGVLLQRYALYFNLLRLDLVAMWLFVLSTTIALFGLRPVTRFAWVWALLFMVFPLPYHIIVVALGGSKVAAGFGTLVVAGVATGIVNGRHFRRGLRGSVASWVVGLLTLTVMAWQFPNAPLLAYQMIPAVTAICLVAVTQYLISRRGAPKRVLDRQVEPLAARQIWSAIPVVVIVAVLLSLVRLPDPLLAPANQVAGLTFVKPLTMPAGWDVADTVTFPWVSRMYSSKALLVRQKVVAEQGDPRYDKFGRPRTLMVDATTTDKPFTLQVYPARVLYQLERIRLSPPEPIDLGYGIKADVFTAVDDRLLVTWDALQWTWTNGSVAQRVLILAVDNHEDNAPFPQPVGAFMTTVNSLFTVLFRGNSAEADMDPAFKDRALLVEFGRAVVRTQLEPIGVRP